MTTEYEKQLEDRIMFLEEKLDSDAKKMIRCEMLLKSADNLRKSMNCHLHFNRHQIENGNKQDYMRPPAYWKGKVKGLEVAEKVILRYLGVVEDFHDE
jgi:hypothetical protein